MVFKQGIYIEVTVREAGIYKMLRSVIHMPTSLQGSGLEGILGNFNGDATDDLVPEGGIGYNPDTVTADNLFAFGNSCKGTQHDVAFYYKY